MMVLNLTTLICRFNGGPQQTTYIQAVQKLERTLMNFLADMPRQYARWQHNPIVWHIYQGYH